MISILTDKDRGLKKKKKKEFNFTLSSPRFYNNPQK